MGQTLMREQRDDALASRGDRGMWLIDEASVLGIETRVWYEMRGYWRLRHSPLDGTA